MHKNWTLECHYFPSHGCRRKNCQHGDTKGRNGKRWGDNLGVQLSKKGLYKKGSVHTYGNGGTLARKTYGNLASKMYGNG